MSYHVDYNYTDKSIVIFGISEEESTAFKNSGISGPRWNNYTDKRDGQKKKAWMCSNSSSNIEKIKAFLKDKSNVSANEENIPLKKPLSAKKSPSDEIISKKSDDEQSTGDMAKIIAKTIANKWNSDFEKLLNKINKPKDVPEKALRVFQIAYSNDNMFGENKNWEEYLSQHKEKERTFVVRGVLEEQGDDDEKTECDFVFNSLSKLMDFLERNDIRESTDEDFENINEGFKSINKKNSMDDRFFPSVFVTWKNKNFDEMPRSKIETCVLYMMKYFCEYFYE